MEINAYNEILLKMDFVGVKKKKVSYQCMHTGDKSKIYVQVYIFCKAYKNILIFVFHKLVQL